MVSTDRLLHKEIAGLLATWLAAVLSCASPKFRQIPCSRESCVLCQAVLSIAFCAISVELDHVDFFLNIFFEEKNSSPSFSKHLV